MSQYPAFLDGEPSAYGVTFPGLPGIVAMGETMDDALANAEEALRDHVTEAERDGAPVVEASQMEGAPPPEGSVLVAIPLIRLSRHRDHHSGLEKPAMRPHLRPATNMEEARMAKKTRATVTYDLKRGSKVVYRGTTKDPERREREHRAQGKDFNQLKVTSRRMTDEGARAKEAENLARYRRGHGGRNPQYNDDADG